MTALIIITVFMTAFFIHTYRMWCKRDYKNEYFYGLVCSILWVSGCWLYQFKHIILQQCTASAIYYFLVSGSLIPFFRFFKETNNTQLYEFTQKWYGISTLAFIFIDLLILIIVTVVNVDISRWFFIFNFLYVLSAQSLTIYVLIRIREMSVLVILKNWISYVFICSFTEITNFLFNYNGLYNYFLIIPALILFAITRGAFRRNGIE